MDTWTPLWSKIVDSSLWCEPDFVCKVFITMMAKKDADHVYRGSAFTLAQQAKKTEEEVIEALKLLAAPDTRRIEPQPHEGRRIEKVADGEWLILNSAKYRTMMSQINRRAQKAEWARNHRAKSKPHPGEKQFEGAVADGDKREEARIMHQHIESLYERIANKARQDEQHNEEEQR